MKYFAALLLILCSCSSSLYSYRTKHGIWVYDKTARGVPKADLELLVEKAKHLLEGGNDYTEYDFFFYDSKILVGYKGKPIEVVTLTDPGRKQVHIVTATKCLVMSSIIREMVLLAHDPERKYANKELWRKVRKLQNELVADCDEKDIIKEIQINGPSFNEMVWE